MLMSSNDYDFYSPESSSATQAPSEDNQETSLESTIQLQPLTLTPSSSPSSSSSSSSSQSSCPSSSHARSTLVTIVPDHQSVIPTMDPASYTDYIDELASDLESRYWESKPPEHWTSEDVWHWIFSWASDRSVDVEEVQPLAYSNMTGSQLISMSRNDFVNLNPKYGGHIYETLQSLSSQFRDFRSNSLSSASSVGGGNGNTDYFFSTGSSASLPSFDILRASCLDLDGPTTTSSPDSVGESDRDSMGSMSASPLSASPPFHHPQQLGGLHPHPGNHHHHHLMSSSSSTSSTTSVELGYGPIQSHHHQQHHQYQDAHGMSGPLPSLMPRGIFAGNNSNNQFIPGHPHHQVSNLIPDGLDSVGSGQVGVGLSGNKKVGRRGRPPKKDPKGRSRQGKGNGKLWEFIRDLLLDPMTNPSFIRWERREDGVFKFVQSDKVAKLWGQRKQNPRMTYEKLSRAMRYYYKSQVLLPVFGRRLVYKFGPNATGLAR